MTTNNVHNLKFNQDTILWGDFLVAVDLLIKNKDIHFRKSGKVHYLIKGKKIDSLIYLRNSKKNYPIKVTSLKLEKIEIDYSTIISKYENLHTILLNENEAMNLEILKFVLDNKKKYSKLYSRYKSLDIILTQEELKKQGIYSEHDDVYIFKNKLVNHTIKDEKFLNIRNSRPENDTIIGFILKRDFKVRFPADLIRKSVVSHIGTHRKGFACKSKELSFVQDIAKKLKIPIHNEKVKLCNEIQDTLIKNELSKKDNLKWVFWFNESLPIL